MKQIIITQSLFDRIGSLAVELPAGLAMDERGEGLAIPGRLPGMTHDYPLTVAHVGGDLHGGSEPCSSCGRTNPHWHSDESAKRVLRALLDAAILVREMAGTDP